MGTLTELDTEQRRIAGSGTPETVWQSWARLSTLPAVEPAMLVPPGSRAVIVAPHPDDARSKILRPSSLDASSPADDISRRIERLESEFSPDQVEVIARFLRRLTEELSESE